VVECKEPLRGDKIKLEQTKKEHLSFTFIEVFTAQGVVEEEESEEEEITVEGPATKLGLKGASMSTTYSGSFPASNALNSNGARTAITSRGVGQWWKATMSGGESVVERVRIKNRHDCCG